jgi:acyl-CoA synthetase (AMP-forming)/AMP-acid ligase II
MGHPKVLEAAVIAIPDEQWAERPMACVVLTSDAGEVSGDDLIDFLAPTFARFWLPLKSHSWRKFLKPASVSLTRKFCGRAMLPAN